MLASAIARTIPILVLLGAACVGKVSVQSDADPNAPDAEQNTADANPQAPDAMPLPPDATAIDSRLAGWCTGQSADMKFFVTSMNALWALSDSTPGDMNAGFGGDFGGITGADEICQTIAVATGHGDKTWHAFLSAIDDGAGNNVHAIERIGTGPWNDANGRLVATGLAGLLAGPRPDGDPQTIDDLPDECGVPLSALGDAHDIVTASNNQGRLFNADNPEATCNDWTTSDGNVGSAGGIGGPNAVQCGHAFPRSQTSGLRWIQDHGLRGCGKGANLLQNGAGSGTCIGCAGGYGGLYCFAL